jgi:hypothetical protein
MTDGRASTRRLPAPCARPARAGRRRARAAQGTASAHVMDGSTARCAGAAIGHTPLRSGFGIGRDARSTSANSATPTSAPPRSTSKESIPRRSSPRPRATCPDDVGQRRAATLSDRTARRERPGAPLRSDASRRVCRDSRRSRASSTAGASSVPAETLACRAERKCRCGGSSETTGETRAHSVTWVSRFGLPLIGVVFSKD